MASYMAPALSSSPLFKPLDKSPIITPFSPSSNSLQINFEQPRLLLRFNHKTNTTLTTIRCAAPASNSSLALTAPSLHETNGQNHWIVVVKAPPLGSRPDVIDYYVQILTRVLGSEKDAQGCIYNASCDTQYGFCCDLDEEASQELARLPEVLSIKPDPDVSSIQKDYSDPNAESGSNNDVFPPLFPAGSSKDWVVRVEMPESRVIRAQVVDYYTELLTKVLGNEKDAQMCMYHISLQPDYGFCCELDDDCAKELAGVPGVISVTPDENVYSDYKDSGGYNLEHSSNSEDSSTNQPINIKTKKLFVTGLSFYTSEKTLRAAFEGFGELVEVKIIMDKISKRSKGFAFIEYTTEEAAAAALKEMNGKIINGWMIVVDVAKTKPPKYSRGRPRPTS
ncbi:putative RNA recognition motif domain, nucleotide-binding alpha-beta plait domain superfamily [Helianthus annuus]|uniref:Putative nucleotide-binding alpha-beta plait domain-containing protein n=1 Tax=Helianthus annuus TaxID=4232 RepID=A0A251U3N1_HELAN|nr:organelle RRM domain-containing protein 1, chloroplastic isoform X2 [Helianthus annuus]KAF5794507.1 putative RNA recognition motif domain, nucleotide-binding alpha-beta plait domain superfamily [Helianthus annuus]KAJ0552759.1 putative peptidase S8 propeptide/proteinase inhibitor I9 superfamily [Helianthus annuus]KAJ0630556.1 putative peptidase S8 propeptide/proteinase inhibitor I9 superfamily [Helianthus annuus]KAJ0721686.1 putative peptidase S8 propeptide/proteinase inhibitor I9 superfamily